ncbi:MAG: ribonuclease HII [Alphaproteobacteria bacterium]
MPDNRLERAHGGLVAGVDEAGRGPWAGPVVAAAVVLDPGRVPRGLDDSKRLSPSRREVLYEILIESAAVGVGLASVAEIDRLNIRQASFLAMRRAVARLPRAPGHVLIDGDALPGLGCPATAVIGGDRLSVSIAAASIIAKVTRDRLMTALALACPGYGFERHKGYGTALHRAALARLGASAHHRRSFRPVAALTSWTGDPLSRS